MARFRWNSSKFKSDLTNFFGLTSRADSVFKEVGELVVREVKAGVRRQKPYVSYSRARYAPLSDSTIRQRNVLSKFNRTQRTYSERRSNLTFTGQLVDAISYDVVSGGVKILVEPTRRRSYLTGGRRRRGVRGFVRSLVNNRELAEIHARGGFNLPRRILFNQSGFDNDESLQRRVRRVFAKRIRKFVAEKFNRRG